MITRRGFLQSILAAGVAPYVVTTSGLLMPTRTIQLPQPAEWAPRPPTDLAQGDRLHLEAVCPRTGRIFPGANAWVARGDTRVTGTLDQIPGTLDRGVFVPADMLQVGGHAVLAGAAVRAPGIVL